MKKNNNNKGFTIVELVIVIAVIGILAAVLIPTFGNIIADANKAAAEQEAVNIYKQLYTKDLEDGVLGNLDSQSVTKPTTVTTYAPNAASGNIFVYTDGTYTVSYDGTTWTTTP